jgi:hypothetical protein
LNFVAGFHARLHLVQKTEPDAFLKTCAECAVDYVGREAIVWIPLGSLILAVSLSLGTRPLVAFLACGGLLVVLMLRRKFKLDEPINDPARIAATPPQITRTGERVLAYVWGEIIGWAVVGVIWWLFVLMRTYI